MKFNCESSDELRAAELGSQLSGVQSSFHCICLLDTRVLDVNRAHWGVVVSTPRWPEHQKGTTGRHKSKRKPTYSQRSMARDMESGQVGVFLVMRTVKELVNVEMEPCSLPTDSTSGRDRNMELNQVPEKVANR